MLHIKKAGREDHAFIVLVDLLDEGITDSVNHNLTESEIEQHSDKMLRFITDADRGAYILEETATNQPVGLIMYLIANRDFEYAWPTVYKELDRSLFQEDGRFMEIFQLWIHPDYRRQGWASRLKMQLEKAAREHEVNVIYTHTEAANPHVIELNAKLGYREVRRGPIWDAIPRVSLMKHLE